MNNKILALSSDHAGIDLRQLLQIHAAQKGWTILDLGCHQKDGSVDYPDYAQPTLTAVLSGQATFGVLVCGTGIGMSIAANRLPGIRAALCHHVYEAQVARAHNDANILCLGGRILGSSLATACLDAFLDSIFEGGRHAMRLSKMENLAASCQEEQ